MYFSKFDIDDRSVHDWILIFHTLIYISDMNVQIHCSST